MRTATVDSPYLMNPIVDYTERFGDALASRTEVWSVAHLRHRIAPYAADRGVLDADTMRARRVAPLALRQARKAR